MIKGIGTDVVNIERIRGLYIKDPQRFVERILSMIEVEKFSRLPDKKKVHYLAKRFAGKEAFAKAMGLGIAKGLSFRDISILNDDMGQPYVKLNSQHSLLQDIRTIHISLSDDDPFAIAFVVILN